MKLLPKLMLISACCWAVSAQAQVGCHFVSGGYVCPGGTPRVFVLKSTTAITLPGLTGAMNWGTDEPSVFAAFPVTIYNNFSQNTQLLSLVTGMDNYMLARLSTELAAHDASGYTPLILQLAARQLNATQLSRLRSAFGPTLVNQAVTSAPAAVQSSYYATAAAAALPLSQYSYTSTGRAKMPELDTMLPYDLFLEAYSMPGNMGVQPALNMASRYVTARVKNIVIDIIVIAAAVITIAESKTGQAVAGWLQDVAINYDPGNITGEIPFTDWRAITVPGPLMPACGSGCGEDGGIGGDSGDYEFEED